MNLLENIIDEHFLPSDKDEIISLFTKHQLFQIINDTITQLRHQLQNAVDTNKKAPTGAISITSSNLLVSVNTRVKDIADPAEKRKVQQLAAKLSLHVLLSIVRDFKEEAVEIFEAVKQALQLTCSHFGYEYADVDHLMNLKEFKFLVDTLTGKEQASQIIQRIPCLVWTSERPVDMLSYELKKSKWIKRRNEFEKLFGNTDPAFTLQWNSQYHHELAHLLFRLAKGYMKPSLSRGYFSIAEKHIVDYSGKKLKKDSLKKISSAINMDVDKYAAIIRTTEALLKRCG